MSAIKPHRLFVTATGTDCGKTIASAILCQALKATYWKPIQTGPAELDADRVKALVSYPIRIAPPAHLLAAPVSPHLAARLEGKQVRLSDFELPLCEGPLVVEGAGGVLVPLNEQGEYVIQIAEKCSLEVVVVVKLYLGCINHALLTIQEIKSRGLTIKGLIFNGEDVFGAISFIGQASGLPTLLVIHDEVSLEPDTILRYSNQLSIP